MGGLVSSITGGLFGGGGGSSGGGGQASSSSAGYYGPGTAQIYQPTGQYQADQSYQNLVNNLGSYGNNIGISQYLPQVEGATSNYVNNPNYVNNQMAADTAGKSAGYAGGQDIFTSEGLTNQIQGLQNESAQIGQQAFDPQNALYNQQVQHPPRSEAPSPCRQAGSDCVPKHPPQEAQAQNKAHWLRDSKAGHRARPRRCSPPRP